MGENWEEIQERQKRAKALLTENGITYFIMGDAYVDIKKYDEVTEELEKKLGEMGFRVERS